MEYLTKQNHDLEEQLYQRNAGLNNQGEKQEGSSPQNTAKRQDREGPEGNNALSREERQDTWCPPIADIAPPYMVMKMQMMKERMDFMMNTFKGWVLNDLNKLVH